MAAETLTVPNEIWIKALSYLDTTDLLSVGLVNRTSFLELSSDDSLWFEICKRRWKDKLNVSRFFVSDGSARLDNRVQSSADEEDGSNRGSSRDSFRTAMTYCYELIGQFGDAKASPPLNMGSLIHPPTSWKESYWMAELDSRRESISREELVHFKFQLIYNGIPSRMGLRQFDRDGFYHSPYLGSSEWLLHGPHLLFAGMSLFVERDKANWGWIIGRGQRTEYRSVEESLR